MVKINNIKIDINILFIKKIQCNEFSKHFSEIEYFIKSDLTWHKSTKKFGSADNFFNILWNNALEDKLNIFKSSNFKDFKN